MHTLSRIPSIFLVVLLGLLTGCTTMGVERVSKLQANSKIVTLSLMGGTLAIRHIGTTIFQNEKNDLDVTNWQIDAYSESKAAQLVRGGGRFAVIDAKTDEARKAVGGLDTDLWTSGATIKGGAGSIVTFANNAGAEYVLVLGPAQLGDPFFGTNQAFSGYGIYQRSMFWSKKAVNYLTMRIVLFDGKTGEEIARTHGFISSPRPENEWMESDKLIPDGINSLNTRNAITQLIDNTLRKGVAELKLVQ